MQHEPERSRRIPVIAAILLVIVLAGLLGLRLVAEQPAAATGPEAQPPAAGPEPSPLDAAALEIPCWSCPGAQSWRLRFRTDLDLLAPLGTGSRNAGELLAPFEKEHGSRAAEAEAFMARRRTLPEREDLGAVVPPDDPLLAEAELMVDQARMWFYPDIFAVDGPATRIPNLLLALSLARSWIARGVLGDDPEAGLEDCRRAIRLGRLLRQEDVVLITDLVGLACIHIGTRGVYEIAQATGDRDLALLASIIVGEVAPQRLYTSQRIAALDITPYVVEHPDGSFSVDIPGDRLDTLLATVTDSPDARFRGEAILGAQAVLHLGPTPQRTRARAVLADVAAETDDDLAAMASWALHSRPTEAETIRSLNTR